MSYEVAVEQASERTGLSKAKIWALLDQITKVLPHYNSIRKRDLT